MTALRILQDGDPILRQVAAAVTDFDRLGKLERDMRDTMRALDGNTRGFGLAAPQIGVSLRAILVGKDFLVNPVIVKRAGTQPAAEGCLSVKRSLWGGIVTRAKRVTVEYQSTHGECRRVKAAGFMAACFQHEIDHLNGILFTDYLKSRRGVDQLEEYTNAAG